MELKREEVTRKLEAAMVAVTSKPTIEQSNTFVFNDGKLITFDGEICSRQDSPFGDKIEGSVIAHDFLKILQRFPDDVVKIDKVEEEIIIKGKRRRAGVKMNAEVLLPYSGVPVPTKFKKIPKGLMSVLAQAAGACGKDETAPKTTHIHIAENRVEATDSFRIFRADIDTHFKKPLMIHAINIVEICRQSIEKISPSKDWLHLKCTNDMIISVLCCEDTYYSKAMMDGLLEVKGKKVKLPADLIDTLSRAEIMDTPNMSIGGWDSQVTLRIAEGVLEVTSQKEEGWFKEKKKLKYKGPEMAFSIHPNFLKELINRTDIVVINDKQIKIEVDNIHFTASLEKPV